jgi:hypothetical protein
MRRAAETSAQADQHALHPSRSMLLTLDAGSGRQGTRDNDDATLVAIPHFNRREQ